MTPRLGKVTTRTQSCPTMDAVRTLYSSREKAHRSEALRILSGAIEGTTLSKGTERTPLLGGI